MEELNIEKLIAKEKKRIRAKRAVYQAKYRAAHPERRKRRNTLDRTKRLLKIALAKGKAGRVAKHCSKINAIQKEIALQKAETAKARAKNKPGIIKAVEFDQSGAPAF